MSDTSSNRIDYLRDPARLAALEKLDILGSAPEETFDAITRLACLFFGVELATIHLIDDHKQWVKSSSDGVCAGDTPLGQSFCEFTVSQGEYLLVPDLSQDPRFADSHFVIGPASLRFYAGMPLTTSEGYHVGTLCLLDSRPNVRTHFSDRELAQYRELANVTIGAMELRAAHDNAQHDFLRAIEEDPVTGLRSQDGLLLQIARSLDDNSHERAIGIIAIRLQGLEEIKNGYGGRVFDQILQEVANRLRAIASPLEWLSRVDDHTFLMVRMFSCDSDSGVPSRIDPWAKLMAESALDVLGAPFLVENESFNLDASVGIARSLSGDIDTSAILDRARDVARRAASPGNRGYAIGWGTDDLSASYRRQLSLKQRLRNAISNEELTVVYQPIVDLQSEHHVVGAEALVRWPQSEGTPIGPDLFIPLAEDLGLIDQLGIWVFQQACRDLRHWQDAGHRNLWVSVNVSPLQLHDTGFPALLKEIASQSGVEPSRIKLEITESALIEQFDDVNVLLNQLVSDGFGLALDDFGTGHSSLSRLIHLPFQTLKVDRAFVSDCPDGPGAAVVASLSGLAASLSLETVGEGVETKAQAQHLRSQGYSLGQGYLYSRPLSEEAFLAFIRLRQDSPQEEVVSRPQHSAQSLRCDRAG